MWKIDPDTGERQLELEMDICGESEGLDLIPALGGELHWLIAPFDPDCRLTFGPTSALLHFVPTPAHRRFDVEVIGSDVGALPGEVLVTVRATRDGQPLRQARVTFAGATARTDKDGTATVSTALERPGRFKTLARKGQGYGVSELLPIGVAPSALPAPAIRSSSHGGSS